MIQNHRSWRSVFKKTYVPHLTLLLKTIEGRLLPVFGDLDAEARKIQDETYEELMHSKPDPDGDPTLPAIRAEAAGVEHYLRMSAVKQAVINACAPLLFHAWEQQLLEFHRLGVLGWRERNDQNLLKLEMVKDRLANEGVDLTALKSWPLIHDELRLVANTAKHADGGSAEQLKKLRPDLFKPPWLVGPGSPRVPYVGLVSRPLSGNDLYIRVDDLHKYGQATVSFWGELADALAAADSPAKPSLPTGDY